MCYCGTPGIFCARFAVGFRVYDGCGVMAIFTVPYVNGPLVPYIPEDTTKTVEVTKYRVIACGTTENGIKYHNFPIGTIVENTWGDFFTDGKLSQYLEEDEFEEIEE